MPYGMSPIAQPSPRGAGSYSPSSPGYSPTSPFITYVSRLSRATVTTFVEVALVCSAPLHTVPRLPHRHLGRPRLGQAHPQDTLLNHLVSDYRLPVQTSPPALLNTHPVLRLTRQRVLRVQGESHGVQPLPPTAPRMCTALNLTIKAISYR